MSVFDGKIRLAINGHDVLMAPEEDFDAQGYYNGSRTAYWHGTITWSSPVAWDDFFDFPTRRQVKKMLVCDSLDRRRKIRRNGYWRRRNALLREMNIELQRLNAATGKE